MPACIINASHLAMMLPQFCSPETSKLANGFHLQFARFRFAPARQAI
jgi:hypothetical protein